ncbi:MAG: hypothetical protein JWR32_772 [Mycobacterium sp.]|jgi:hypothetical protein|nr:hypothetical protein [Mycobacterium sp.]
MNLGEATQGPYGQLNSRNSDSDAERGEVASLTEGWGFESLRARSGQRHFPSLWKRLCWFLTTLLTTLLTTVASPLPRRPSPSPCRAPQRIHGRNRCALNLFDHIHVLPCGHRNRAMPQNALHRRCLVVSIGPGRASPMMPTRLGRLRRCWQARPWASRKQLTVLRRWCRCCGSRAPAWCGPAPRPTPPCKVCW